MPQNKDFKRLVRQRMAETGEPYTTARVLIVGGSAPATAPGRHVGPTDLVQRLADKGERVEAMRALMGGVTATELRSIRRLPDDVLAALVAGLHDTHPPVRYWCVQLLDHVPDERALAAVAQLLDDPVDRVRRVAVHALGCAACKPTADAGVPRELLDRLRVIAAGDPSAKVRREAELALACRRRSRDVGDGEPRGDPSRR